MKISLQRITSILQHSEKDPKKKKPAKLAGLRAIDDSTCQKISLAAGKSFERDGYEIERISPTQFRVYTDQRWIVTVTKERTNLSSKQATSINVVIVNGGRSLIISDWQSFLNWFNAQ